MYYVIAIIAFSLLFLLIIKNKKHKTRTKFLSSIFLKKELPSLEHLKKILYSADLEVSLVEDILNKVSNVKDIELAKQNIKELLFNEAVKFEKPLVIDSNPFVIMMVGVNGVGKTTMSAKLAYYFKEALNKKVMLIGADTFRAGAVEQLKLWSETIKCEFFSKGSNTDPSATAFEGIREAKELGSEIIIIDTGGRMHNKENLMHEVNKLDRVIKKQIFDAPHLTLMVIDATMGQNVIKQSKVFNEFLKISGLAFTKLDGTAKGGTLFKVAKDLELAVYFMGVGEKLTDLKIFNAKTFTDDFI